MCFPLFYFEDYIYSSENSLSSSDESDCSGLSSISPLLFNQCMKCISSTTAELRMEELPDTIDSLLAYFFPFLVALAMLTFYLK